MICARGLPIHQGLVDENIQVPPGHHTRIKGSQGSCRGVARIGEERLPILLPLPIEFLKGVQRQEDLPSHLDLPPLPLVAKRRHLERHRPYGADVGSDILAPEPVASGDSPNQRSVFEGQGQAEAVDLELADKSGLAPRGRLPNAPVIVQQLAFPVGIVQAQHREGVLHRRQPLGGLASHPLSGRIGSHQLGMGRLQALELPEELVELPIGDFGGVQHVVAVLVVANPLPQSVYLLRRLDLDRHDTLPRLAETALYQRPRRLGRQRTQVHSE